MFRWILLSFIVTLISCKTQEMIKPDQSIHETFPFELQKYLGTWYEIARFDHPFERGLEGVTATYSLRNDGKIKVLNQGYKKNLTGKMQKAIGKAMVSSPSTPRNLKVSFFLNFYAPYNILELDPQYQYVLLGSNSPNYLWILSRTPQMDPDIYKGLIEKAKARGYNTDKILKVIQPTE